MYTVSERSSRCQLKTSLRFPSRTSIHFLQESVRFHSQDLGRQCIILAGILEDLGRKCLDVFRTFQTFSCGISFNFQILSGKIRPRILQEMS